MSTEPHKSRALESLLPEDVEAHDLVVPPVEVPPPDVLPADAARDTRAGGAFAFLSVFRHRNYRLFFAGQLVSLMGTWITNVAQAWLVYSLSHSPLLLGLSYFASQVPVFFLSPFGGMLSDRFDRRRLLLVTQSLSCLESLALAVLTLTHLISVSVVIGLALFQGFVNAFDVPSRQGMTVDLVGREDLRHAISLNSMMFNTARIIGPSVAGILIALVGTGWCFGIDAVSYAAVIASLLRMQFPPRPERPQVRALKAVGQGFAYAWHTREIRLSLMLIATCSVFGASYLSMLAAIAHDVLHQGSEGLGFLYGAVGGAALLGAYTLARIPDRHLFAAPAVAAMAFGVALILFSRSQLYWLSFFLLMPTSFCLMVLGGATNSIAQLVARDDMRGRVVAFYAMAVMGMMPWGSLLLGWISARLGVADAITAGGVVCVLAGGAAWYERRSESWKLKPAE